MSDQTKPEGAPTENPEPAAQDNAEAGFKIDPSVSLEQMRGIIDHLQNEADAANARAEAEKNQTLRLLADMENLRRRTEREKEETAKYAITKFAKDVVDVGDNFQRAIQAVPAKAAEEDAALKSLLDGVILAERAFLAALERHGVRQVSPAGQPFNPHQHQAVMETEDASVPAGTVLQVFQAGYMIEDRCLRPAMVTVSRGGPKASAAPAPDAAANSNGPGSGTDTSGG